MTKSDDLPDLIADFSNFFGSLQLTPLVVDLGNNGMSTMSMNNAANTAFFDMGGDGFAERTGWIAPSEASLVRDLNQNGVIDNVTEMFGGNGGTTAYQKLAQLDASGNGALTGREIEELRLWVDADSDGITDAGELKALSTYGIARFDLAKQAYSATNFENKIDGYVNVRDSSNVVISKAYDVAFKSDKVNSWYVGTDLTSAPAISAEALLYPLSRGYGTVKPLLGANDDEPKGLVYVLDAAGVFVQSLACTQ